MNYGSVCDEKLPYVFAPVRRSYVKQCAAMQAKQVWITAGVQMCAYPSHVPDATRVDDSHHRVAWILVPEQAPPYDPSYLFCCGHVSQRAWCFSVLAGGQH